MFPNKGTETVYLLVDQDGIAVFQADTPDEAAKEMRQRFTQNLRIYRQERYFVNIPYEG